MTTPRRIALLGGSFDPPHLGHLHLAYQALEQLGCDEVWFIPAHQQPLKGATALSAPSHRLAMVRLMVEGIPGMRVDPIETERGGLSFAVDTVRALQAAEPGAEFCFFLGADAAATLHRWREPAVLASLCRIIVCTRGEESLALPDGTPPVERLATRRFDLSATEVRARVRAGLPVRGWVTDAVAAYIAACGLYRVGGEAP
ncbi:MAG: nicotinate (nicotinamide) nucleotide adenylyltransferase [Gemmatimonadetes bacterium]|nr:nicotinate (nicotinamide) nucleotide adenylyltransferase [Gemmatimonadota bacterium]